MLGAPRSQSPFIRFGHRNDPFYHAKAVGFRKLSCW
jgi:hypothetical protein